MAKRFKTTATFPKAAKVATVSTVALSLGSFLIDFLPHTFYLEKYKSIVNMYRFGQPTPLEENLKNLFVTVLDDLKIDEEERKNYDPFPVTGFNLHHAGMNSGRFGVIIGIPVHFTYQNKLAIDTSQIRLGYDRESLNMYHPATENLIDSLVLSEKAKKFGIAREILMSQKMIPLYRSIENPAMIIATVFLTELARIKLKLSTKPMPLKILIYGASGLLGYSTWFQVRDKLNTYFEKAVDAELANLGPDYVEGGKEFYEKLLQRNIALRILMGEQGVKSFNRDGDEIFFIRHKRTPISHRKKFFSEFTFQENEQQAL